MVTVAERVLSYIGYANLTNITPKPAGSNYIEGGKKIENGIDTNGNNILDAGEVKTTNFICNGKQGENCLTSLVRVDNKPLGIKCATSGKKVSTGIDDNKDGTLQDTEIDKFSYVCNGATADNGAQGETDFSSLVNVSIEIAGIN